MSWHIEGDYFESCNCEAICPCRTVGGVPGGRSTYGICMGVLSWLVREGHADGVDLGGLAAAFVIRYDDDEPGSPWSFVVHVDERGSEEQREALAAILTGKLGGDDVLRLPWVRKPSEELAVRTSPIELRVGGEHNELRVGSAVELTATRPVPDRGARLLRHPGPPHRRHRVLRRTARRARRAVRLGARGQLRLRQHVLLLERLTDVAERLG